MKNKSLNLIMQSIVVGLGLYTIFSIDIMFNYVNGNILLHQILFFIGWAFYIFSLIRICNKNVKKAELIVYHLLSIFVSFVIAFCLFYVGVGTEEFLGVEDSGLGYFFQFILMGVPYIIVSFVLEIITLVKTAVTKTKSNIIENNSDKNIKQNKTEFCRYCGNKISQGSAFCKYCGKKIE